MEFDLKMDYVFVTGATGFLGKKMVQQLLSDINKKPWKRVIGLVRNEESSKKLKELGAESVIGSLLETPNKEHGWGSYASNAAYVVHCAQPPSYLQNYQDLRIAMESNLLSVLDGSIKRIIFVYGSSYFGRSEGLVDETMVERQPIGLGPYFEKMIQNVKLRQDLDMILAYPGAMYGVGSWFTESFLKSMRNNNPIILANPSPIWPFIHLEDVARSLELLLQVPKEKVKILGNDVILVDNCPITIQEYLKNIRRGYRIECYYPIRG